jgi:putative ABC transport system substrate-binding protein
MPSSMRRRLLVAIAGAPAARAVRAQERVARVGFLSWQSAGAYYVTTERGFVAGLADEGYVEGRNVIVERRSADNDADRFKALAAELADAKVDVFFAPATPMATAAWYASRTTPIVIATIMDPVELKFVKSLARPGTRVTGVTTMNDELMLKRMELLKEVVPGLKRVGFVIDDAMRSACTQEIDHSNVSARGLGLTVVHQHFDRPESIDAGYKRLMAAGVQAVMMTLLSTRHGYEKEHAQAALKAGLPSMHELEIGAREGALLSYGPDFADIYRRAGRYVGRLLKGARASELPMEEPREFTLAVNLRTAEALRVVVPPAILVRADVVIR